MQNSTFRSGYWQKAALAAVLSTAAAYGGAISTVGEVPSPSVAVVDITGFDTTGAEMNGLLITGTFAAGGNASCAWAATGPEAGACSAAAGGNGFNITLDGDTFTAEWILNVHSGSANLTSLLFSGLPGFTVFDRTIGGLIGTVGSDIGKDANGFTGPANVNGNVTYHKSVGSLGNPPIGDEFAEVVIDFTNGGMMAGSTAQWVMDTDNIGLNGGTPGSGGDSTVPEPGTVVLVGLGLGVAGWLKHRR